MSKNGLVEYALGGASYATPVGIITGGNYGLNMNAEKRTGIGGVGTHKATKIDPYVKLEYLPVDANGLLTSLLRSGVSLPDGEPADIPLEVGSDEFGLQANSWKCNTATLTWEVGAALAVSLDLLYFGKPTITAGGKDHSACPKTTFECSRGAVLLNSAGISLRKLTVNIDNQYQPFRSGNTRTADEKLYPESGGVGSQVVTATGEVMVLPGQDLSGDDLPSATGNLVATAVNDATSPLTVTLTLVTPRVLSWETSFTDNTGYRIYTVQYALDDSSAGITLAVA